MNKRTLYLECFSGISGDMTVASLLDLGADEQVLLEALDSLNLSGFKVKISRTKKCGIDACDFDVILENNYNHNYAQQHEHEHYHEHSNNHEHSHENTHVYECNNEHNNDHKHIHYGNEVHEACHSHHHHEHRNLMDIYEIIENSRITESAKNISKKIFDIVAKSESKAHGIGINDVHFHEVGAIDSIIDIVATAVCIDNLNINDVVVSKIYEGSGHVKCQHGIIPVPVPAVVNILAENSLELKITEQNGEMVTPTGVAIAAALKTKNSLTESYRVIKVGIGAGKKNFERANILRTYLIEENTPNQSSDNDNVWVLETNIDDATGESLGFTMERLFEYGAYDAFFTPIYMKKNRPAFKLTVICNEENVNNMEQVIFNNTSTIGIRKYIAERTVLKREIISINTHYGKVRVKVCYYKSNKFYYPEYEDIKSVCIQNDLNFKDIYDEIKFLLNEIK